MRAKRVVLAVVLALGVGVGGGLVGEPGAERARAAGIAQLPFPGINGFILDEDENPVEGVHVEAFAYDDSSVAVTGLPTLTSVEAGESDAWGRFALTEVMDGVFVVLIGGDDWMTQWAPGVDSLEDAEAVEVLYSHWLDPVVVEAAPELAGPRELVDEDTGVTAVVSGEGDCDVINVEVEVPEVGDDLTVEYDIDRRCQLTGFEVEAGETSAEDEADAEDAEGLESEELDEELDASSGALAATTCNWLHSSQSVKDVINLTIARSRLHTYRCWDGSKVRYQGTVSADSYTALRWNHPTGISFPWVDRNWASTVSAQSVHSFHTDWAWCNARGNWQSIVLRNTNYSTKTGGYSASFVQDRSCPLTHMATEVKATSSSSW